MAYDQQWSGLTVKLLVLIICYFSECWLLHAKALQSRALTSLSAFAMHWLDSSADECAAAPIGPFWLDMQSSQVLEVRRLLHLCCLAQGFKCSLRICTPGHTSQGLAFGISFPSGQLGY